MSLKIQKVQGRARATTLTLHHGPVRTPVFMPVGTQGTVKGLTASQLKQLDCEIILGNTYHLALRPGADILDELGGLHKLAGWDRNILTDSGGFQMVSLLALADITEEGVTFQSPVDGTTMLLTPEESMRVQNCIGSDIMMVLDDVVSSVSTDTERFKEATARTIRWLDRCIKAHKKKDTQCLFAITQGGLDVTPNGLRDQCLDMMLKRDKDLPGYAIGGLAGGESKDAFWKVVAHGTKRLPSNKPRYLMGVGYPLDLVVCTSLGVDMYDCVYPTRTARFGTALVPEETGLLKLKQSLCAKDHRPIEANCPCEACQNYTRARIHYMLKSSNSIATRLITMHNISYMMRLVRTMRSEIINGTFDKFVDKFLKHFFKSKTSYPKWVCEALTEAGLGEVVKDFLPKDNNNKKKDDNNGNVKNMKRNNTNNNANNGEQKKTTKKRKKIVDKM